MNSIAAKTNPIRETQLVLVPAINRKSRFKRFASHIQGVLVGLATPRFDHDAWRRLEFKNEFTHEHRHERYQWRI